MGRSRGWKLKLSLLAVAAVACVLPATASAVMTMPANTLVPVGTQITATNTAPLTMYWANIHTDLVCETFSFNGEVVTNQVNEEVFGLIEMGAAGAGAASECTLEGAPISVTEPNLNEAYLVSEEEAESGFGSANLSYVVHYGPFKCTFTGTFESTFLQGASTLHLQGWADGGPCGEMSFEGDFALATTKAGGGGAVTLD